MSSRKYSAGFTLLELLVVLFIIGISVTFAVLSFSGSGIDSRLKNEAHRLQQVMRLASEEALLQGVEIGMRSDGEEYSFLLIGEEGWVEYEGDTPFKTHKLETGVELEVTVEDFALPPPEDEDALIPQIVFLSSGEITPFDIDLSGEAAAKRYRFKGTLTGVINLEELEADAY